MTTVRPARPSDGPPVAEVFLAARAPMTYLPVVHSDDETREYIAGVVAGCTPPGSGVEVAEIDGRPLGYAQWSSRRGGWLDGLYVEPAAQSRGVGKALLDSVRRTLPGGFWLWVFQENAGARRFYERHGCHLVRETDGSGNEERTPDALYRWPGRSGARLRAVDPGDVAVFFEHQREAEGQALAGFVGRDRPAHDAHWAAIMADPSCLARTVLDGSGQVAGNIGSWLDDGQRLVGYWIGREHWGRGLATAALTECCGLLVERPLLAHVVEHNLASRRVLERCGFVEVARHAAAGDPPLDELVLRLDE